MEGKKGSTGEIKEKKGILFSKGRNRGGGMDERTKGEN